MGQKDFWRWHVKKGEIHDAGSRVYFHEREIWWCAVGANVGFEQDGKGDNFCRPVLIFKKFNNEVFWAIPLSKRMKSGRYYVPFLANDCVPRIALISQLRLFDAKRLMNKRSFVKEQDFQAIQKAVIRLCG